MADTQTGITITDYASLEKFAAEPIAAWSKRNDQMKIWYRLIQMVDDLAKDGMESFVGNDPRSSFNLILHMLDTKIPHRIPNELLTPDIMAASGEVETILSRAWTDVNLKHRRAGRQSWVRTFISYLLATGWYSAFAGISKDKTSCWAEVWNPATVYPDWDDQLWRCVHKFKISANAAKRAIATKGWQQVGDIRGATEVLDLWYLDDGGRVHNVIGMNKMITKPDTVETLYRSWGIPIIVGPCGGLPDDGGITGDTEAYRKEIGQSIVATNASIYKSWNRWWTFSMQLLHDTAQPRWIEKSSSSRQILKPEDMFKRGAIFKMGLQDDIRPLDVPNIPVELRGAQLDMEAMMERGGVSWAAQGNFRGQLTSYVMAQVIASTAQVAKPFHHATIDALSDIDNLWLTLIRETGAKPYDLSLPKGITSNITASANYEVQIPGDFIQRANAAKMISAEFTLSNQFIMDTLFPEIPNPYREMAKVKSDRAQLDEVFLLIDKVKALRREAEAMSGSRDTGDAQLFEKAAAAMEAKLTAMTGGGQAQPQPQPGAAQGGMMGGGAAGGGMPGGAPAGQSLGPESPMGASSSELPPDVPR